MKSIDTSKATGAIFSDDRKYRYALWRLWSMTRKPLMFIGLNPSTATEITNDPTVVRCMTRAAKNGFGGLLVANLYAFVSSNPNVLTGEEENYVGKDTDEYILSMSKMAEVVVCGWGSFPAVNGRADAVLKMVQDPHCLGVNMDGHPKHPLYISYDKQIMKYKGRSNEYANIILRQTSS